MMLNNLITILKSLPLDNIEAAVSDPTNLSKDAAVVEDIIVTAMPGLPGEIVASIAQLLVIWIYG